MNRLGQKLGCELGVVTQNAFSIMRFMPVEDEGTHRQARAGYHGDTVVDGGSWVMFG
jgi:hypothetical protein